MSLGAKAITKDGEVLKADITLDERMDALLVYS
jgi:hypothetical protein